MIVCEGDADCHFYAAIYGILSEDARQNDLAFVHGAGKSRIVTIVRSLRAIGVPTRVVVDFDVLSDVVTIKSICEALDGTWVKFERDYNVVKSAIEQLRTELSCDETKQAILSILNKVRSKTLSDENVREVKRILSKGSAWVEAKRLRKRFIPSGEASAAYERLSLGLRSIGLYVVDGGELESFCPTVGKHGLAWLPGVFELDLKNAPELAEARKFVGELIANW